MKLSVFSDEISPDPVRAIELAVAWGIPAVELRGLPGGRFPAVDDGVIEDFARRVADAGLAVSGVSPGFFKCPHDDPRVEAGLAEGLPRACEWAQKLGTDLVTCFAAVRGAEEMPGAIVDMLGRMTQIAAAQGCRLALENEAGCWGGTGDETAALIRRVGDGRLRLCWDPGNAVKAGADCPYPGEYQGLKDLVAHLHVKNFDPQVGGWALIETGTVDWPGQLAALKEDGYDGYLVIETHLKTAPAGFAGAADLTPLEANTRRNLEYLRAHVDGL